ncbi:flagellar export protein FliJ [Haliovirga abyssi]|uniref:Flagellar FliJ protein n=1 Tax=Haliovirga abyssi TaxID=2996794 RepID=A0AAU9D3B7_9FUSO|nr:flagellar export protein FliJ [Haliovirga abyssi]BDU50479.1 hypothetical protein HLVA_10480 [Haliovirga abyssi]
MFKFRFQKALEFKQKEEDIIKDELKQKRYELNILQEKLIEVENEIKIFMKKYSEMKQNRINIMMIKNYDSFLLRLKKKKEISEINIKEKEKEIEKSEELYFEKRKEKKTFEKLKEKYFERYKEEEIKKEQKFIDEISNNMYNRRK